MNVDVANGTEKLEPEKEKSQVQAKSTNDNTMSDDISDFARSRIAANKDSVDHNLDYWRLDSITTKHQTNNALNKSDNESIKEI